MPPDCARSPATLQIESRLPWKKERKRSKLRRRQWNVTLSPMTASSPSVRIDGKGYLSRPATRSRRLAYCFVSATSKRKVGLRRASSPSEIPRSLAIHLRVSNEERAQRCCFSGRADSHSVWYRTSQAARH